MAATVLPFRLRRPRAVPAPAAPVLGCWCKGIREIHAVRLDAPYLSRVIPCKCAPGGTA